MESTYSNEYETKEYSNTDVYSSKVSEQPINYAKKRNIISQNRLIIDRETYYEFYYEDPNIKYEWKNGSLEVKEMSTLYNLLIFE